MTHLIRPLHLDEAALYRDIRLEALRTHPESFSASFEHEAAQPLTYFAGRLTGSVVFAGVAGETILGTSGFTIQAGAKRQHKGTLWGMYVRPEARRTGLSRRLVEAVLDHARERVELVQLTVTVGNVNARRLYLSCGFEPYGIEERALKVEGRYVDEELMVRRLP